MIKNVIVFFIWQVVGIIVSQTLILRSNKKTYALFVVVQTIVSLLIFEYASKYAQLGYFSSNTLLLTELLRNYLKSITF
ncbi:hypothetical protein LDVICp040 [lymphocystis disease virus-China]|uniref:Uncharacterized protein n=2 Tax=Lymphocystis disease virus 2 TaxID=159183 RepID=A0A6F8X0D9_9VIRU|nr:hypothetical protein LDVICp040 [lymphocystis disease virus-China]AAU10887.1 hypothetical protein [lymphocystis disease virus-China]BCB67434.1 hypothetical protein [Lymphocystis disease virus 2]